MKHTYTHLHNFILTLDQSINKSPELSKLKNISESNGFYDEFIVLIGLAFLEQNPTTFKQFYTNRFFLDAIGLKLMPTSEKFNNYLNFISKFSSFNYIFLVEACKNLFTSINTNISFDLPNFSPPLISKDQFEFLDSNGYLIIHNAIPLDFCDTLLDRIMKLAEQEKFSSKGGYFYGSGKSQRIYHLLGKDPLFCKAILHPTILQAMDHFFNRETLHDLYYLTSYHANILGPGAEAQILHVDAAVPEPLPLWTIRANSNLLLQDYIHENGATEIFPGSHKFCRKPKLNDMSSDSLITLEAPKGSLILWHGNLWHRSGNNNSNNFRVALLGTFCASFFREMCMEENPYLHYSLSQIDSMPFNIKNLLGWNHGRKEYS